MSLSFLASSQLAVLKVWWLSSATAAWRILQRNPAWYLQYLSVYEVRGERTFDYILTHIVWSPQHTPDEPYTQTEGETVITLQTVEAWTHSDASKKKKRGKTIEAWFWHMKCVDLRSCIVSTQIRIWCGTFGGLSDICLMRLFPALVQHAAQQDSFFSSLTLHKRMARRSFLTPGRKTTSISLIERRISLRRCVPCVYTCSHKSG